MADDIHRLAVDEVINTIIQNNIPRVQKLLNAREYTPEDWFNFLYFAIRDAGYSMVKLILRYHPPIVNPTNVDDPDIFNGLEITNIKLARLLFDYVSNDYPEYLNDAGLRYFNRHSLEGINPKIVRLLFDRYHLDPNYTIDTLPSMLSMMVEDSQNKPIVTILLRQREINVNLNHDEYGTALQHAIMSRNYTMAQMLLAQGADVNVYTDYPPLVLAIQEEDERMFKLLIEGGANPNLYTHETPLMVAIRHGNQFMIEILIDIGADPFLEVKSSEGEEEKDIHYNAFDIAHEVDADFFDWFYNYYKQVLTDQIEQQLSSIQDLDVDLTSIIVSTLMSPIRHQRH